MDVIFLLKSDYTPSSRIRGAELIPLLSDYGIRGHIEYLPKNGAERRKLLRRAGDFDLAVLQKRLLSAWDLSILRKAAKKLIFDFDDAIYCRNASPSDNPKDYESRTRMAKFKRILRRADLVIAANKTLAARVQHDAPECNLEIIPSPVPTDFPGKESYHMHDPPSIGWIGTRSTLRYLEAVAPALRELRNSQRFRLRVIADAAPEMAGVEIDFVPWELSRQEDEIRSFDIGIMPLSEDPFASGKAAYKLLQYLSLGVPAVASAVGMNCEIGEGEKVCLLAADMNEFSIKLARLLEDEDLRCRLGMAGRQKVAREYSRSFIAGHLAVVLKKIATGRND